MITINLLPWELRPVKRTPLPYLLSAAVLLLALMGIGLFLGVALLERLLLPWYHTERRQRALEQK